MRASIMEHNTGCHKLVAVIASETTDAMSTLSSGNASIQRAVIGMQTKSLLAWCMP